MLASPGELFMIEVAHGKPSCVPWTIEPDKHRMVSTRGATTEQVQFHEVDRKLQIDGRERLDADGSESTTCGSSLDAVEDEGGLTVDHARWFHSADACAAAIAHHERVATELPCALDEPVADKDRARSQQRFEKILRRGGAMYSIDHVAEPARCIAVRFKPYAQPNHPGAIEGDMTYPVTSSEGKRGTETYGYDLEPDQPKLILLGPSEQWEGPDAGGSAFGCMDELNLTFRADSVEAQGPLYFESGACRAALREQAARDSWFPSDDDATPSLTAAPLSGGC